MKAKLFIVSGVMAAMAWAVPIEGAAHLRARPAAVDGPDVSAVSVAHFRVDESRGLMLRVWINGTGPYLFAIDTGAGTNIISQRLASELRLAVHQSQTSLVGGLSRSQASSNHEAVINRLAVGGRENYVGTELSALVVSSLPPDVDGILDPTQTYAPDGYSIDIQNGTIAPLSSDELSRSTSGATRGAERATVPWINKSGDNRPFVRLGDGRIALLDTGSRFGLAINDRNAGIVGIPTTRENAAVTSDVGGGLIRSQRVSPTTISIGDLVLRGIPTDILLGTDEEAPIILGRDALYPFRISFDSRRRIIEFVTSMPIVND